MMLRKSFNWLMGLESGNMTLWHLATFCAPCLGGPLLYPRRKLSERTLYPRLPGDDATFATRWLAIANVGTSSMDFEGFLA
jgi:hypothetical protein